MFEEYIISNAGLSPEEYRQVRSLAVEKKFRRRELVVREGEVCRWKVFVETGLLRNYRLKSDGMECITRFAPENTWTTDHESYMNQTPCKNNIEALEDSRVLLWAKADFDELYHSIPRLRAYSDRLVTRSFDATVERLITNIGSTSEEKYQDFIASFPDVFRRVPLYMVASYLGVSRETLSRIRHAEVKQK